MKKEDTRVLRRISAMLLIILTFTVCATGCDLSNIFNFGEKNDNEQDDDSNISGPIYEIGYCTYKSDKTVFDIDDVTLDFYYSNKVMNQVGDLKFLPGFVENAMSIPYFELFFVDEEENKYLIKRVEENFISEKYISKVTFEDDLVENVFRPTDIKYNHSEAITIPKELFKKDKGVIKFEIRGLNIHFSDEIKSLRNIDYITSLDIAYKVEGDKVILISKTNSCRGLLGKRYWKNDDGTYNF